MNKLFLVLTARLAPLWTRLGADPVALRVILETKLLIGDRTPLVMGQAQKEGGQYGWLIYFFMLLFGLFFVFAYYALADKATAVGLVFTVASIYLGLMLVMEMSENMFDVRDLTILLTRPINDATFSLSRALHIFVFASKFGGAMLLPLAVALVVMAGPLQALLYFGLAIMCVVTTVAFTLGVYLTLLKHVPTERVRRVLSWVQIVMTVFFFTAYQLPNLLNMLDIDLKKLHVVDTAWGFGWPGFWLGAVYGVVSGLPAGTLAWLQAALGIAVAGAGVAYYLSQGRGYGDHLLALQLAGSQSQEEAAVDDAMPRPSTYRRAYRDWFARTFTRPGVERASLGFHWAIMSRDLKYKQQVYPALGMMPVLFLIIGGTFLFGDDGAGFTRGPLVSALYFLALLVITPLANARISDSFRASWVLQTNPLDKSGSLFYGQLMAALGQFLLPVALVIYALLLAFTGLQVLDDVLLSVAAIGCSAVAYQMLDRTLPFSQEKKAGGFSSLGPTLAVFFIAGVVGAAHYGLTFIPYGVPVAMVVAWGVCWLAFRGLRGKAV